MRYRSSRRPGTGVLIALAFLAPAALAAGMSGPPSTVDSVRHLSTGDTLVEFTLPHANPDGCDDDRSAIIRVAAQHREEMVAAALLAKATGSTVRGWLSGCVEVGGAAYARLANIVWE